MTQEPGRRRGYTAAPIEHKPTDSTIEGPAGGNVSSQSESSDLLVAFREGTTVYDQGSEGRDMFIVASGTVRMVRRFGNAERDLGVIEKGDFFGEMSLLEGTPRRATAVAGANCQLLPIDAATFAGILRQEPELLIRMLRKLSRRLYQHEAAQARADEIAAAPLRTGAELETPVAGDGPQPPPLPGATAASAVLVHEASGTQFPLSPQQVAIIGRYDSTSGTSPEIDLTEIDSGRSLSRRHARIHWKSDRFYLCEEPGVSNGTFLGSERLAAGADHPLEDGARLRCGIVDLVFKQTTPG